MSLFFITENYEVFLKNLINKINPKGFFVANFLGKDDEWKERQSTIEKDKLLELFKDFDLNYFSEEKYYSKTVLGKDKFWHVYTIMAQLK